MALAALFLVVLTALTPVLGSYLERVFERRPLVLLPARRPPERGSTPASRRPDRRAGLEAVRPLGDRVQRRLLWRALPHAVTQGIHPWNPQGFDSGTWDVSFNTAASFVSNTSWQFYAGETTLSNFSQMAGIAVHSFLSAAVGLAAAIAVIRGFSPPRRPRHRELLGRPDPIPALRAGADRRACDVRAGLTGRRAVARRAGHDRDPCQRRADVRAGTGRVTGGDQDHGVGRRRLLQRQLGDAVQNASGLASFVQALLIVLIPAALTSTFGRMVGSRAPGLDALRGHGRPAHRFRRGDLQPPSTRLARPRGSRPRGPQPRRQGAALRHRRDGALAVAPRAEPAVRSTGRWRRSPGSARLSRWRT